MEQKKEMVCTIDVNYINQEIKQLQQSTVVQKLAYLQEILKNAKEVTKPTVDK